MPYSVYMGAWSSSRCMPAVVCTLHHYISATANSEVSVWFAILHNCTPLLFRALRCLCPHTTSSLLCSSACSPLFQLGSMDFSANPFLPSNFYRLTNTVRWSWLACTLHKQTACLNQGLLKARQLLVIRACMESNGCGNAWHCTKTENQFKKKTFPESDWIFFYMTF